MTSRIGWIDATGGISGDMLLGACLDAGVELAIVRDAIAALRLTEQISWGSEPVERAGLGATRAHVSAPPSRHRRTLADILDVLPEAGSAVAEPAAAVFRALAEAEARVHGMPVEDVHFHEVGALDSIADVVGVIAALQSLRLDRVVCSPIALGAGRAQTEHGSIPIPGPAVVELLRARTAPGFGGPIDTELATPTGVALMTVLADEFGPLPELAPDLVGVGAGSKDPAGHANVTRLVVGTAVGPRAVDVGIAAEIVLEANVDDLDPRLWPQVLTELLAAGASDAWLTPIVMKKGRLAHTLSVLTPPSHAERLQRLVFTHTSTIGLRRYAVDKLALARETVTVEIYGRPVRVKIARLDGEIVNAVPEYEDVARLAVEVDVPAKVIMTAAYAATERGFERDS